MKKNNGEHQKDRDYKISPEFVIGIVTCFLQFSTLLLNNGFACCVLEMIIFILILVLICLYILKTYSINRTIEHKNKKIIQKRSKKLKNTEDVEALEYINSYIDKRMKEIENCIEEKRVFSNKCRKLIGICVVAFIFIGILNADTIYAYVIEIIGTVDEDESILEDNNNEEIIRGMSFYLEKPDIVMSISLEDVSAIFYVNPGENINAAVRAHVQQLLDENKRDTFNNNLSQAEESIIDGASSKEMEFDIAKEMVKHYATSNDYIMWKESLMTSKDLDEILNARLSVWDSNKCDEAIAALIANNYQDYALEYQNQDKNGTTILYYYMQTIRWSEYAISYEGARERQLFYYIKGRYYDIMNCLSIPREYRDSAKLIYNAMGEYEEY